MSQTASVAELLNATARTCLEAHHEGRISLDEAAAVMQKAAEKSTHEVIKAMVADGLLVYSDEWLRRVRGTPAPVPGKRNRGRV